MMKLGALPRASTGLLWRAPKDNSGPALKLATSANPAGLWIDASYDSGGGACPMKSKGIIDGVPLARQQVEHVRAQRASARSYEHLRKLWVKYATTPKWKALVEHAKRCDDCNDDGCAQVKQLATELAVCKQKGMPRPLLNS